MVTAVRPTRKGTTAAIARKASASGANYVTRRRGKAILDRQAKKYLGMSGQEFVRRYRAGEIEDADRSDVARVAMLIPMSEH